MLSMVRTNTVLNSARTFTLQSRFTSTVSNLLKNVFGNASFNNVEVAKTCVQRLIHEPMLPMQLAPVVQFLQSQHVTLSNEKIISSVIRLEPNELSKNNSSLPIMIMTSLHGNEPAGLASVLMTMVLSEAGLLKKPVYAVLASPYASRQYFQALNENPYAPQVSRDAFRGGVQSNGKIWPDPNRIPNNFLTSASTEPRIVRAKELAALAGNASAVVDLHTARGDMRAITECTHAYLIQNSPIRNVFVGLLEAIGEQNANAALPLKEQLNYLYPNLPMVGIEAGRHEDLESASVAAAFTLKVLNNLNATDIFFPNNLSPHAHFVEYHVDKKLTFADLISVGPTPSSQDKFYSARTLQINEILNDSTRVITGDKPPFRVMSYAEAKKNQLKIAYAVHEYNEMQSVHKHQVLAVSTPSGIELRSPKDMSMAFVTKSSAKYSDPGIGLFPVPADQLSKIKFCYPCTVKNILLNTSFAKNSSDISWFNNWISAIRQHMNLENRFTTVFTGNEALETVSPLTGYALGVLPVDSLTSIDEKISQAQQAQSAWSKVSKEVRIDFLNHLAQVLTQHADSLAHIISLEAGKTSADSKAEVQNSISVLAQTIKHSKYSMTAKPAGVVGLITSFNFPGAVAIWTIAPALLAGNTVVWKGSEKTSLTAIAYEALINIANDSFNNTLIPKKLVQIIVGEADAGKMLVQHPLIKMISATGSVTMGKAIQQEWAKKADVLPPLLELGGNNAIIISKNNSTLQRAQAMKAVIHSALGGAGQRCTATRRLIVDETIYDEIVEQLKNSYEKMIQNIFILSTDVGPLIDQAAFIQFEHAKQSALNEGGKVHFGRRIENKEFPNTFYVEPTLIEMPIQHSESIVMQETFAPVLYVIPYRGDINQAIQLANAPENAGLVNAIFSEDKDEIQLFKTLNESGHTLINPPKGTSTPAHGMGFKGNKDSGTGVILSPNPLAPFVVDEASQPSQITTQISDAYSCSHAITPRGETTHVVEYPLH